jgi:hypothetical protein
MGILAAILTAGVVIGARVQRLSWLCELSRHLKRDTGTRVQWQCLDHMKREAAWAHFAFHYGCYDNG